MDRRVFLKLAGMGGAALVTGALPAATGQETATSATSKDAPAPLVNPFDAPGRWYRANFHSHTTTSDGSASPAQRVEQYRQAGYAVLALTDHYKTNDIAGMSDERMLVISGTEYHPSEVAKWHLVGLNVPRDLAFTESNNANRCIEEVAAAGGITILAHPYWSGVDSVQIDTLRNLAAIEVYNACCEDAGWGHSENEWNMQLARGRISPCVAVDDCHSENGRDRFRGWTWLKMPSLTVENVLQAVRTGCSYASNGPEIKDFRVVGKRVRVECSPAVRIFVKSKPPRGHGTEAMPGEPKTSFECDVPESSRYVRAVVVDAAGNKAWTNPILL